MTVTRFQFFFIFLTVVSQIFASPPGYQMSPSSPGYSLEIPLQNNRFPDFKLPVSRHRTSMTLIFREALKVTNQELAADFSAIDIWATGEDLGISVRISVIYNDLSNQEWWKDKKEKILGTYFVPEGQVIILSEMNNFGIKPFEMKAVRMDAVSFEADKEVPIINKTTSLQVLNVKKSNSQYRLLLRNTSDKDIIGYSLSSGSNGLRVEGNRSRGALIPAGSEHAEEYFTGDEVETEGITIDAVFFQDGTFDGDERVGNEYLAKRKGMEIQTPNVLQRIRDTLRVANPDLESAFTKLESELWTIPEAIDKDSALDLLKELFPNHNDKEIGTLYEALKGGLYEARNNALSPLGEIKRFLENSKNNGSQPWTNEDRTRYIRARLIEIEKGLSASIDTQ